MVFDSLLRKFRQHPFEKNVVGQHHLRLAGGFEHAADVLLEVEMVVAGAGPNVLTVEGEGFPFLLSLSVVEGLAAILPKGGLVSFSK